MIKAIEDCLTMPVGTYLDYDGKRLKVEVDLACKRCYFYKKNATMKEKEDDGICKQPSITEVGYCSALRRSDKKSVIFKLVSK